jgi:hypothetical protein
MNDINEGGPAFPGQVDNGTAGIQSFPGMTLRDYFAAKAMQGFCANPAASPTTDEHFRNIAQDAFYLADTMITTRGEK